MNKLGRPETNMWPRPHQFTVIEYHRMAQVGLLPPDVRVELLEGVIYAMGPFSPLAMLPYGRSYRAMVNQLNTLLVRAVGEQAIVQCQGSIPLDELCEAQPEFALLAPRQDNYRDSEPRASDVLLVIEVSDTTLRHDTRTKMPVYARHGIPELWVVDVQGKRLRTYRRPVGSGYDEVVIQVMPSVGAVPIAALPGASVDLSTLWEFG